MKIERKELYAVATVIILVGAAALGFVVTRHQLSPSAASKANGSTSSTSSTPSATSFTAPVTANPNPTSPCPTQSNAPSPTPTPTKTVDGLELGVSLEKTVFNVGESVNVTLTITNISQQTVNFTHTGMDFDFLVYNDSGGLIYQWSVGKAFPMFITIAALAPGGNVTATYTWPQTCNVPASTTNLQVPPGTYYIVGKSNPTYGLQTAPTQITIISS